MSEWIPDPMDPEPIAHTFKRNPGYGATFNDSGLTYWYKTEREMMDGIAGIVFLGPGIPYGESE